MQRRYGNYSEITNKGHIITFRFLFFFSHFEHSKGSERHFLPMFLNCAILNLLKKVILLENGFFLIYKK